MFHGDDCKSLYAHVAANWGSVSIFDLIGDCVDCLDASLVYSNKAQLRFDLNSHAFG